MKPFEVMLDQRELPWLQFELCKRQLDAQVDVARLSKVFLSASGRACMHPMLE
jgi:hypothetical protein